MKFTHTHIQYICIYTLTHIHTYFSTQGGHIKAHWYPDEPCFTNVTLRQEIPMAIHAGLMKPLKNDKSFLLREAAKLGELYEVERQVCMYVVMYVVFC
jgi:hypothetical protein